ncbi:MAG: hypothetical protein AAEJ04_10580 [Planctomycetota bacterium]
MKIKALLLLVLSCPLLFSAMVSPDDGAPATPVVETSEKPFLLLATVHNYGYIEPCG